MHTKSMKFSSLFFQSSGAWSPSQSLIKVIGRCTVQITLQLFALSLPRAAVPQLQGTSVTQDGSSVRAMSAQMASITSFPRTAPGRSSLCPLGRMFQNKVVCLYLIRTEIHHHIENTTTYVPKQRWQSTNLVFSEAYPTLPESYDSNPDRQTEAQFSWPVRR